ncbi:hypothetical protein SAMN05421743_12170 [Thalassobacillus cyri]|uniref:Replication terminator protein n=1 Tax=Thalassobacillus cyri TaxID=571932 RepID=A0A1H4H2A1_9BACI|nr:hypothetical protein [Thalassobacillus cyri]SEB15969.1 hypothetical protein SAMN05421743_12170 [Thalassobacillus cyri]
MENNYEINLSKLANGGLQERFNAEMERILDNIADQNTDPGAKRKVTMNITFKPNDNRDIADTVIEVKSTLAPAVGVPTSIVIGQDNDGKVVGQELKSRIKDQTYFDEEGVKTDTGDMIYDLRKSK